jgi:hypothetical protein
MQFRPPRHIDPLFLEADLVCLVTFVIEYCHDIAIRKRERECPIYIPLYRRYRFSHETQ